MAKQEKTKKQEQHEHRESKESFSLEDMQIAEQGLNNLMLQKQMFQIELIEINNALEELKKTKEDVYKIVGNLMFKSKPGELTSELERKRDIINLRIKAIETQEKNIGSDMEKMRDSVLKNIKHS